VKPEEAGRKPYALLYEAMREQRLIIVDGTQAPSANL
jgi:hypothetical protein